MVGVYFSGTGNTKYCVSKFLEYYNDKKENDLYSIEDKNCITKIKESNDIVFAYPIYYSDIPIIVKDFLNNNKEIFKNKNIRITAIDHIIRIGQRNARHQRNKSRQARSRVNSILFTSNIIIPLGIFHLARPFLFSLSYSSFLHISSCFLHCFLSIPVII